VISFEYPRRTSAGKKARPSVSKVDDPFGQQSRAHGVRLDRHVDACAARLRRWPRGAEVAAALL